MKRRFSPLIAAIAAMVTLTPVYGGVVLSDSLNGSTSGTREGGTFTGGGWRVDGQYDSIRWHTGTYPKGAFEYNVTGLSGGNCPGGLGFKNELSHIYDFTWNNADVQYAPGYRDDPYKQYIRKQCESGKVDTLELVWAVPPDGNFIEPDTGALSWSSGSNYLFRTEWENTGGQAILRIFRDGGLVFQGQLPGSWSPAGQSVRIAASPRRADEGAAPGAIYSNVKVYDDQTSIPNAPSITAPSTGETVNTQVAYIQWSGDSHTRYQLRTNTANNPDSGIVWDSGQVDSGRYFSWTGTLNNGTFYAFVRLGTGAGWGAWSSGRQFTVNTSFVPGGIDYVKVKGNSYVNNSGPFLGLGFTYMRALYNCKFQRTRYTNDCTYMASKGYNYLRDLTMVEWDDLEIAPVSFTNSVGQFVPAWGDYWQQFKDSIDIAYSAGLKTEVTIFASAQNVMPSDSTRTTHMNNILANIVGREHKIVLIEIANEHYQNGLPDINDVRNKANFIASQTPIPVSLSSPADTSNGGIVGMYSGSAADLCTVHFSRDISAPEGGWRPVRDGDRTIGGIAPLSSNEPIGAGSSVNTENDPIKLNMAACFGFTANLISYVYHSRAGVFGWTGCCPPSGTETFFNASPGNDSYVNIMPLLPKELASWEKSDGKNSLSPFTNYCMGQADRWWTEVGGATNGCLRNISAVKNGRFVTTPISILGGGLEVAARRPMQFKAYNPLTGGISYNQTLAAGNHFTLGQGTGAYVIIGDYTDVPIDSGAGGGGGSNTQVSINLGTTNAEAGMTHPQPSDGDTVAANIGGRDCRRNVTAGADNYFYFGVSDGYAFNGNKPNHWIRFDYYDTGTGTAVLEYDGASSPYTAGGTITYTNTNTWKTATFNIVDAYFGNRQNNGADFRLARSVTFYVDTVYTYIKAFSGTSIVLPATVQAEDFNNGGPGQGYNDADVGNNGGQYRLGEQVDIETCSEGGFNVGWLNTGEWLQYQINVTTAGNYDFGMRVASGTSTGQYHLEIGGVNVSGTRTVTSTGGIQTWATQTVTGIALTTGVKTLRVFVDTGTGNWNFNSVTIAKAQTPFGGTARTVPGIVQAEDFDDGGQGVAYSDTDSTNSGGQYRTTEGVDIETCTDTGGGFNVGFTNAGEWMEYTINVTQAGDYTVQMRVASCCSNAYWHFDVDGGARTTGRGMATTGGWQSFTTVSFTGVFLPAGIHVFRVLSDSGGYNFNYMNFVFQGADVVSCDLDQTNINDGMTSPIGGDGDTIDTQIGGHLCRKNMDPSFNDFYYYFTVTDIYAFQGNKNSATITVDYFDTGTQSFSLQYDGTPGAYTQGATVVLGNTNTWKTATFQVSNAYFGNRQNNASDFRLAGAGLNHTFYIDTVTVFCTTGGPVDLNNSPFNSNQDGWNIVVWHVGPNLDGTMAWQSANGNPTGNMRSAGSGATNNTDTCTREGGEINKAVSTAGRSSIQVVYDVRFETDQTGTTCIGTCVPLEGNCADKLAVYYSTAGTAGPWTLLEAVNALSVTQNVWSTRTLNVPAGGNNQANFAVRFRWQFNTATDGGRLDNVRVIGS